MKLVNKTVKRYKTYFAWLPVEVSTVPVEGFEKDLKEGDKYGEVVWLERYHRLMGDTINFKGSTPEHVK